jgi:PadR family transcriptional regulator, regulatory protein PadR
MEKLSRITPAILDVLRVLMAPSEESCHGFAIAKDVRRPTGSVYPILARLERAGWVESSWELEQPQDGRPRRRLYHLTPEGLQEARAALAARAAGSARKAPRPGLALRSAGGAA